MGGIQKRGAVPDRAADPEGGRQPAPGLRQRHPATSRFQTVKAAAGCRDADRPAAIGCMGERHHASRHRRRGAAGRAAGGPVPAPGIARRPAERRLGGDRETEFGCGGPPGDHQARPSEPAHQFHVLRSYEASPEPAAILAGHPLAEGKEILDQEGHAREGGTRRYPAEPSPGIVIGLVDDGVERRIARLDTGDGGLQHFRSGDVAAPDRRSNAEAVLLV